MTTLNVRFRALPTDGEPGLVGKGFIRNIQMASVPRIGEIISFENLGTFNDSDYSYRVDAVHWYVDNPKQDVFIILRLTDD